MNEPMITLTGSVTADPELRFTPTGKPVAHVQVAVNPRRLDQTTGQWVEGTATFWACQAWGVIAEHVAASLTRGDRVVVTGRVKANVWTPPTEGEHAGIEQRRLDIVIDEIGLSLQFHPARSQRTPRTGPARPAGDARTRPEQQAAPRQPRTDLARVGRPRVDPTPQDHVHVSTPRRRQQMSTDPTDPLDPTTTAALPHRADNPTGAYLRARVELHAQAVAVVTAMVRQPAPHRTSETDPTTVWAQTDFAGFLANVLATVAANVGSIDRVLAGRPKSWEAGLVRQLLTGKLGEDEARLITNRTEPILVGLNVPDLAAQTPGFPDVEQALIAYWAAMKAIPEGVYDPDQDWRGEAAILDAYAALYAHYAAAFTAAVHRAADAQFPTLLVDVVVTTVTDYRDLDAAASPTATGEGAPSPVTVRNPWDGDDPAGMGPDPLALRLWRAAQAAIPVPATPTVPALPELPKTADPTGPGADNDGPR